MSSGPSQLFDGDRIQQQLAVPAEAEKDALIDEVVDRTRIDSEDASGYCRRDAFTVFHCI